MLSTCFQGGSTFNNDEDDDADDNNADDNDADDVDRHSFILTQLERWNMNLSTVMALG